MKPTKNLSVAPQQETAARPQATLTQDDLKTLREAFPKDRLGVKVQSISKDRNRAMLVLYLQHTDVMDRLETVDAGWISEVIGEERLGDSVYVRLRMTVKGVARENVGEGHDPKAAYSDALKRCAMLFGIGRYLYDSVTVWTEYNESRDRYRQWSVDDYEKALKQSQGRSGGKAPVGPTAESVLEAPAANKPSPRRREELNRVLMNLYRPYLTRFPQTQFADLLQERYNVGETRLMSIEQLEDLIQLMEAKLKSVA